MVKIDVSMTLAESVDAFPQLAREFERLGLDYCCGGRSTLGEACAMTGLDPEATIAELSAAATTSGSAEWTTMTADVLVDHLEATHHRYLRDEMPRVTALVDKIVSVHGARHPELMEVASCFAHVCADIEPHMAKEERMLFPMIRELVTSTGMPSFHCGSLRNPISVMLSEHDAVGSLLARLHLDEAGAPPPCRAALAAVGQLAGVLVHRAAHHDHGFAGIRPLRHGAIEQARQSIRVQHGVVVQPKVVIKTLLQRRLEGTVHAPAPEQRAIAMHHAHPGVGLTHRLRCPVSAAVIG